MLVLTPYRLTRTPRNPATTMKEEVVEEMVRASSWKASLQEPNICISFPSSAGAEGHDRNLGARLAHLGDESWALHVGLPTRVGRSEMKTRGGTHSTRSR
jgi:hypothetical protein